MVMNLTKIILFSSLNFNDFTQTMPKKKKMHTNFWVFTLIVRVGVSQGLNGGGGALWTQVLNRSVNRLISLAKMVGF